MARLSKSAIEEYNKCPRCFWLARREDVKLKWPDGIHAGVPKGIESMLLRHYEAHRIAGTLPPELVGLVPGRLYTGHRISLKDLRNWRKGLTVQVGKHELSTALDDLLEDFTKIYSVYDIKTKAKLTNEEDTQKYYGVQADCYDLALKENKYPTNGRAYFGYYAPAAVLSAVPAASPTGLGGLSTTWTVQVVSLVTNPERARELTAKAGECLDGPLPKASETCSQCDHVVIRNGVLKRLEALHAPPTPAAPQAQEAAHG